MRALVLVSSLFIIGVFSQDCLDPAGVSGVCRHIRECPRIFEEYNTRKSDPVYLSYLRQSFVNCHLVKPIICCPLENPQTVSPFDEVIRFADAPVSNCQDPGGASGECKQIKQCPHILNELYRRQGDAEFTKYLRESNRICNFQTHHVCCSFVATPPGVDQKEKSKLPTPSTGCGYSGITHNKVVGGVPAELGSWPWMALLGYTNRLNEIRFRCGGSLITNRHVLTAAHCRRDSLKVVRLGEHDQSTDQETQHLDVDVSRHVGYPKYDPKDGNGDMAIVYLSQGVMFTDKIKPVCLPFADPELTKNYEGYFPFVAGWGVTKEGSGEPANVLQELQVPVLPNLECVRRFKEVNKLISPKQFDNKVLCAGVLEGGKDSCQGDSGGPLMSPTTIANKDYYYQIGVVSYGHGCARVNIPAVYTRVQSFIPWIEERINEL